ncbi:phosphatidylserine decarboxylase [Cyphellophora europaea CBS 101466]|uniref:phosphatidylserine decarboxylase n=1 Tax=Cyphellophora europaea (strain CBS 101466) TaxID=1220924 RepID=W2RTZ1_CYPE1|nr:phosphatidylserine decarboxylase [Cyphellophora europaea CBS 101466]ETN39966.1 phosphatidylserine decarboxylase [Cyphellophora europaea CBS 101466]
MSETAQLHEEGLEQTLQALDYVTSKSAQGEDPKNHLHKPADHNTSHSWLSSWLPSWSYIESMEASYHLGNWVRDRHTDEKAWEVMSVYVRLGMHLLYYGTCQEMLLGTKRVLEMLREQSVKMGRQYDDPSSKAHIQPFIDSFGLQNALSELVEPDPTKYATFNDFFARRLKDDARPIDEPNQTTVTSSPADCRLTAFTTIEVATKFWVKGANFTMERLFQDQDLAKSFDGGSMVIARLAPQDYHRWHSPVSGTVKSVKEIPGTYYTVNPQAINESGTINVYCENRRSIMVVEIEAGSSVAIVAVGAMLVGSIKYFDGVEKPGAQIQRGQCLGGFYYGGSTVLVFYQKGDLELDEDLVKWSTHPDGPCETYMKVGWRIGAKQNPTS